jgi:hypothetical protein
MHRTPPKALAALSALSQSFAMPESFYVLGAGASVPYLPTTAQLSDLLSELFLAHGAYQTERIARDVVSSRIMRDPAYWKDPMRWELLQRLPPNYVIGKLPELLAARGTIASSNYDVFALAAAPSTIFNMNVDSLASRYRGVHRVLEPHGRSLSTEMFERIGWAAYTNAILDFPELPPPTVPGLILPGPEPAEVMSRAEYRTAARALPYSKYVSIIGYSFGGMDDVHTYAFLMARIPRAHDAVLVISPDPYEMMHRLSEELKSMNVHAIPASWHYLAQAILKPGDCRKHHWALNGPFCAPCAWYQYQTLVDEGV